MAIAARRESAKLDLVALSLKLFVLDAKTALMARGFNEKTLHMEREYTHLYASLEYRAEMNGDHIAAREYGALKREHQNIAEWIRKGLYNA